MKNNRAYSDQQLQDAYAHCMRIAREHYENFPVGSLLIPRQHRPAVAAVYAFARFADDIVDEGSDAANARLQSLESWKSELERCLDSPDRMEFIALGDTIKKYNLSLEPFLNLLDAFKQDITKEQYATFDEVLHYCQRSADPVGRIILGIFGKSGEDTIPPSDSLCTGLQLANFWQDVSVDIKKPRIYIPAEDMVRFGVTENDLRSSLANDAFRQLMKFEVDRTRQYFWSAVYLFRQVPLRLRLELKAIWRGGMSILDAIERQNYNVLSNRPALSKFQYISILTQSFLPIRYNRF